MLSTLGKKRNNNENINNKMETARSGAKTWRWEVFDDFYKYKKNSNDEKINKKAARNGSKTWRWKVSDDLLITVQFSTGSGLTATIIVVM